MPPLRVPDSGLALEGPGRDSSKSGAVQSAIGLTLSSAMIEDMINCVQSGKPIQLSLGQHPNLSYGTKTQQLSTFEDPFSHELYQSTNSDSIDAMSSSNSQTEGSRFSTNIKLTGKPNQAFLRAFFLPKKLDATKKRPQSAVPTISVAPKALVKTGDQALDDLQNAMSLAEAKKNENVTKLIDAPTRGQLKKPSNPKLARLDGSRSITASPSHLGNGSPSLGPTSVPASEQQAKLAKAARKPVIHVLAVGPISEKALQDQLPDISSAELKQLLLKVAEQDTTTLSYELKPKLFRELDIWTYDYKSSGDRQKAIDNAIKCYDKSRLSRTEAEWERLKPKSQRGDGVWLSVVQGKITSGKARTPNGGSQMADSGRDTPNHDEEKPRKAEGSRPKKKSESEAQAKRLTSTKKAAPKPAPKPVTKPKEKVKVGPKLSNEFVRESDEEDDKGPPKPVKKRGREEETTSSDSSIPLSKKQKKEVPNHRISDTSQSSGVNNTSFSSKTKGTSPQKSSPLASSPPTNASDFDDSSSSSSTPAHRRVTKGSNSPIRKRHQSSSVTSSASSSSQSHPLLTTELLKRYPYLTVDFVQVLENYATWFPPYEALHTELSSGKRPRDLEKEKRLMEMHERLSAIKAQIHDTMGDDYYNFFA